MTITWKAADPPVGASLEGALEVLERFGLALQQCEQASAQIPLALEAVRESLAADVVFWHPGTADDAFESAGSSLTATWASDFIARVIPDPTGADRLVRQFLDPGAKPKTPWPCSTVLARISRTSGSWLGALSFHPMRTT